MNELTRQSRLPSYLMYPRFLLETRLNDTARLVYILLLDRAKMSMANPGWEDESGRMFVIYPIEDLAAHSHRSQTVVKKALRDLENQGLIRRCRQGLGKANRLFLFASETENRPSAQTKNRPSQGRKSGCPTGGIPTGNKNNKNKNNLNKRGYDYEGEDSL